MFDFVQSGFDSVLYESARTVLVGALNGKCGASMDVVALVDSSQTIAESDFTDYVKPFVQHLASAFDIRLEENAASTLCHPLICRAHTHARTHARPRCLRAPTPPCVFCCVCHGALLLIFRSKMLLRIRARIASDDLIICISVCRCVLHSKTGTQFAVAQFSGPHTDTDGNVEQPSI